MSWGQHGPPIATVKCTVCGKVVPFWAGVRRRVVVPTAARPRGDVYVCRRHADTRLEGVR